MRAFSLYLAAVGVYIAAVFALSVGVEQISQQQAAFLASSDEAFVRIENLAQKIDGRLIDIKVPPTKDRIYDIMTRGLGVTEVAIRTDAVGSTPEAAFTTDLASSEKIDAYVQQIVIRNSSSDNAGTGTTLCWKALPWAGASTCNTICAAAAATLTCTGATTDGLYIAPGAEVARRLDGTNCVCVAGIVGTTAYQTQRNTR